MVYRLVFENILVSCYGNLTVKQKNKLSHVIILANTITVHKQLQDLFSHFMEKMAIAIFKDYTHPLQSFEILPSGHRLKIVIVRRKIKNR